jgi:hypothetical protein
MCASALWFDDSDGGASMVLSSTRLDIIGLEPVLLDDIIGLKPGLLDDIIGLEPVLFDDNIGLALANEDACLCTGEHLSIVSCRAAMRKGVMIR